MHLPKPIRSSFSCLNLIRPQPPKAAHHKTLTVILGTVMWVVLESTDGVSVVWYSNSANSYTVTLQVVHLFKYDKVKVTQHSV